MNIVCFFLAFLAPVHTQTDYGDPKQFYVEIAGSLVPLSGHDMGTYSFLSYENSAGTSPEFFMDDANIAFTRDSATPGNIGFFGNTIAFGPNIESERLILQGNVLTNYRFYSCRVPLTDIRVISSSEGHPTCFPVRIFFRSNGKKTQHAAKLPAAIDQFNTPGIPRASDNTIPLPNSQFHDDGHFDAGNPTIQRPVLVANPQALAKPTVADSDTPDNTVLEAGHQTISNHAPVIHPQTNEDGDSDADPQPDDDGDQDADPQIGDDGDQEADPNTTVKPPIVADPQPDDDGDQDPNPNTIVKSPTVTDPQPDDDGDQDPNPNTIVKSPTVADPQPDDDGDQEDDPKTIVKPPTVAAPQPDDDGDQDADPKTIVKPPTVADAQPDDNGDQDPDPNTVVKPPTVADPQPDDDGDQEDDPKTIVKPPTVADPQPDDVGEQDADPNTIVEPAPVAGSQIGDDGDQDANPKADEDFRFGPDIQIIVNPTLDSNSHPDDDDVLYAHPETVWKFSSAADPSAVTKPTTIVDSQSVGSGDLAEGPPRVPEPKSIDNSEIVKGPNPSEVPKVDVESAFVTESYAVEKPVAVQETQLVKEFYLGSSSTRKDPDPSEERYHEFSHGHEVKSDQVHMIAANKSHNVSAKNERGNLQHGLVSDKNRVLVLSKDFEIEERIPENQWSNAPEFKNKFAIQSVQKNTAKKDPDERMNPAPLSSKLSLAFFIRIDGTLVPLKGLINGGEYDYVAKLYQGSPSAVPIEFALQGNHAFTDQAPSRRFVGLVNSTLVFGADVSPISIELDTKRRVLNGHFQRCYRNSDSEGTIEYKAFNESDPYCTGVEIYLWPYNSETNTAVVNFDDSVSKDEIPGPSSNHPRPKIDSFIANDGTFRSGMDGEHVPGSDRSPEALVSPALHDAPNNLLQDVSCDSPKSCVPFKHHASSISQTSGEPTPDHDNCQFSKSREMVGVKFLGSEWAECTSQSNFNAPKSRTAGQPSSVAISSVSNTDCKSCTNCPINCTKTTLTRTRDGESCQQATSTLIGGTVMTITRVSAKSEATTESKQSDETINGRNQSRKALREPFKAYITSKTGEASKVPSTSKETSMLEPSKLSSSTISTKTPSPRRPRKTFKPYEELSSPPGEGSSTNATSPGAQAFKGAASKTKIGVCVLGFSLLLL